MNVFCWKRSVVLTPFVERLMLGQRPDARLLPAVVLSLLGTWLGILSVGAGRVWS